MKAFEEGPTPLTDKVLVNCARGYEEPDWAMLPTDARRMERRMRAAEALLEELVEIIDGAAEDQATDRRFIDSFTTQPARGHLEAVKREDEA